MFMEGNVGAEAHRANMAAAAKSGHEGASTSAHAILSAAKH